MPTTAILVVVIDRATKFGMSEQLSIAFHVGFDLVVPPGNIKAVFFAVIGHTVVRIGKVSHCR